MSTKVQRALLYVLVAALAAALVGCARLKQREKGSETAGLALTALDEYVAKPDPSYAYSLVKTFEQDGCTVYVLDMTSQTWRTAKEVDKPVWKHWVSVIKPAEVKSNIGLLFIDGGNNSSNAPDKADPMLTAFANGSKTVVIDLGQIPSEPLVFADEGKPRTEDGIVAYTWDKFLKTGDSTWPLRLPMTKASVRAMDTATDFLKKPEAGGLTVDKFVVAGGSKRGWTTWTTAAVDAVSQKRVVGIAPFVIDMLNMKESFKHHYRAYGFWAPAVSDYTDMGLMDVMDKPRYRELMKIVEPYEYRGRLTMPKYVVNSAGDQFFLPDSSQFYYDDLVGDKRLRYVQNTAHGLDDSDAPEGFLAWYAAIVYGKPVPQYSWTFEKDGSIVVKTPDKPSKVLLWQATNPEARDFRKDKIGAAYTSTVLEDKGNGTYVARVDKPAKGWTAFLVELEFPSEIKGAPFKFSTAVRIVPDVLPFEHKL